MSKLRARVGRPSAQAVLRLRPFPTRLRERFTGATTTAMAFCA